MEQVEFLNQVKRQVIIAILADDELGDRLVLKGGNLLQFAYEISSRASKDVDISVDGEFDDSGWLGERVQVALENSFAELELVVFDFRFHEVPAHMSEDLKSFWGGYQCDFKLIGNEVHRSLWRNIDEMRRSAHSLDAVSGSTRFTVDFSRHEFCDDKEEFEIDGYTIFGYSPRMFVAEKIRAICQQMPEYGELVHRKRPSASRARDFVDVHVISNHYGIAFDDPSFHEIVEKIFAVKKVPVEWIPRIRATYDHHEPDFASVKATVSAGFDLQEFDFYFNWVCKQCESLKPLWRE
jgi:hypothetical protein